MEVRDRFRIDSHKLIYHVKRVAQWLDHKDIFPLYIEAGLSQGCNHRCVFCALDYSGYRPVFVPPGPFLRFIRSAARHGVKSIMFAGDGEPLLHPDAAAFIAAARRAGLDTAMTSNAVLFTPRIARECLKNLSWFRASIDAATAQTYAKVHRAPSADFDTVLSNLADAVRIRRKQRLSCVIGGQFLLIEQNCREAPRLARILRDIGLDYLIIKPYSQHPFSHNRPAAYISPRQLKALESDATRYSCKGFDVIFRNNAIRSTGEPKPYARCEGLAFMALMSADGSLYPCSNFVNIEKYRLGNICSETFETVWKSRRKKRIFNMLRSRWDVGSCRNGCRLDEINRYLHALRNPPEHVNFI